MPFLLHESGPDRGKRFPLDRTVQIGRGPLADLEVRDAAVSRRHAQISVQDGRCFLSDLGSGNGTWLNREQTEAPRALADCERTVLTPHRGRWWPVLLSDHAPVEACYRLPGGR